MVKLFVVKSSSESAELAGRETAELTSYLSTDEKPLVIPISTVFFFNSFLICSCCLSFLFSFSYRSHSLFWGLPLNFSFPRLSPAFTFFDPNDPACLEILMDPRTTIPELFAIVRQWVPQVQHKIDIIGNEVRTH